MKSDPIIVERQFDAPVSMVWEAITDKNKMKQWYFDIGEFKPVPGFEFQFTAGSESRQYLHVCEVIEVIEGRKLAYRWKYPGYPGQSLVTFELFAEGNKTRLKLTHSGVGSFPSDKPDFARDSFEAGWNHIIGISLKDFIGKLQRHES